MARITGGQWPKTDHIAPNTIAATCDAISLFRLLESASVKWLVSSALGVVKSQDTRSKGVPQEL
jgi:hypothetical protein